MPISDFLRGAKYINVTAFQYHLRNGKSRVYFGKLEVVLLGGWVVITTRVVG